MPTYLRVLTILLAVLFLATGGAKIAGVQTLVDSFHHFGYPDWFRYAVGITEVVAFALLIRPKTAGYGALILVPIMIGAVASHMKVAEPFIFPLIVLLLVSFTAFVERPAVLGGQPSGSDSVIVAEQG